MSLYTKKFIEGITLRRSSRSIYRCMPINTFIVFILVITF